MYGIYLVVWWLRLHAPNAGDMGLDLGWGVSCMIHGAVKKKKKCACECTQFTPTS